MKKVVFWAFSALVLFFSCGKSDDNSNPTNLTGTWVIEKAIFGGEQIPIVGTCFNKSTITFTKNTMTAHYFDENGNTSACIEEKEERNYQFTNSRLYATEGNFSVEIGHLEGGKLYITSNVLPEYLTQMRVSLRIDVVLVFRRK